MSVVTLGDSVPNGATRSLSRSPGLTSESRPCYGGLACLVACFAGCRRFALPLLVRRTTVLCTIVPSSASTGVGAMSTLPATFAGAYGRTSRQTNVRESSRAVRGKKGL